MSRVQVIPEATACGASLGWFINEYDASGEHVRSRPAVDGPFPGREPTRTHPSLEWYLHPEKEAVYAYERFCKQPVNHTGHVSVQRPIVAAPRRVVHTERFKPNTLPKGVDQTAVPIPHDCENHLAD